MTSSSSAHLALPTERLTLRVEEEGVGRWVFLLASRLSEIFMWHPVGLGTKCQPASGTAHQTLVLLGKGRRDGARDKKNYESHYLNTDKNVHMRKLIFFSLLYFYLRKK